MEGPGGALWRALLSGLRGQGGAGVREGRGRGGRAKHPAAPPGRALSVLCWGRAPYLGTAAWPAGTTSLCGMGRQRARGRLAAPAGRRGRQALQGGGQECQDTCAPVEPEPSSHLSLNQHSVPAMLMPALTSLAGRHRAPGQEVGAPGTSGTCERWQLSKGLACHRQRQRLAVGLLA